MRLNAKTSALIATSLICAHASSLQAEKVCPTGSVTRGVDVGVYQGAVDWNAVAAAGYTFGIARFSDGGSLDAQFAANWTGMKAAGLVRGAYQFFEPKQDPIAQALGLLGALGPLGVGDLPPALDVEVSGGLSPASLFGAIQSWVSTVQQAIGRRPLLYTNAGFWNGSVVQPGPAGTDLWVANWGVSCPTTPTGWSNWALWQNSSTGTVNGIGAGVDLDEFNGSQAALAAYASTWTTAPEPTSLALIAVGLAAIGVAPRRRERRVSCS